MKSAIQQLRELKEKHKKEKETPDEILGAFRFGRMVGILDAITILEKARDEYEEVHWKHCEDCMYNEHRTLTKCGDNCSSKYMLRRFLETIGKKEG